MMGYHLNHCFSPANIVKPVLSGHSKEEERIFKTNNYLIQVKSIAEHSAILLTLLSDHLSLRPSFHLFLSGHLRQV